MKRRSRSSLTHVVFLLVLGLLLTVPVAFAQVPTPPPTPTPEEEEYEYGECGIVIDNADESPCFFGIPGEMNYDGLGKDGGERLSWRFLANRIIFAFWTPDYKSLEGPTEVFVTVPLYRPENLDGLEEESEE